MAGENSANYSEQGGAKWAVGSGGELDIKSGGALKIGGTDKTAILSAAVSSTATGVKIAGGEVALDGSNPTTVATGLTTITGAVITLKKATAPGVTVSSFSYDASGGTLSIYAWKPTSAADPTLIASTATDTVAWQATGT